MKTPYLEDVRKVGEYDVAFLGVPFDIATTYRAGTRFGPQGIRRISSLYTTYNFELGVDLRESLKRIESVVLSVSRSRGLRATRTRN